MDSSLTRATPVFYSDELAAKICAQMASGMTLSKICKAEGMPAIQTVLAWVRERPAFKAIFQPAKEDHADSLMDEVVEIADTELDAQKARNRIDARIKRAASIKPREYGQRVDLNITAQVDHSQAHADAQARLRSMRPVCDQSATLVAQVIDGAIVYAAQDIGLTPVSEGDQLGRPSIFD
ncbi:MAG: hypothetical protein V4641_13025 [Pseudomonadota bacterium]